MMVTSVRIDGCADYLYKKPDLIIEKHKIIISENTITKKRDSSGDY